MHVSVSMFFHGLQIQRLSGVDSDFAPFVQHAGVPSIDIYYGRGTPPLISLLMETYQIMLICTFLVIQLRKQSCHINIGRVMNLDSWFRFSCLSHCF